MTDLRRSDLEREQQRITAAGAADAHLVAGELQHLLRQAHSLALDVTHDRLTQDHVARAQRLAGKIAEHIDPRTPTLPPGEAALGIAAGNPAGDGWPGR